MNEAFFMNGSSSNHFDAREGKQVMDSSKDDERYVLSILKCEEDAAMHEAPSCFKAEQIMLHRRLVELMRNMRAFRRIMNVFNRSMEISRIAYVH